MKSKLLACLVIICVIINVFAISSVNAETTVATIGASFSKVTLNPGDELSIVISASQINEAIAGMSFTLTYDDTLFDYVGDTAGSIWTSSKLENSYTILTKTYEGTTQTGEIITITLRAKSTITTESTDTITISAIELSKDDASTVPMDGELTKDITIKVSSSESGNNSGSNSGNESGNNSGSNSGNESGNNSGSNSGNESGNNSGSNSGNESGNNSGSNSGNESGNNSGSNSGSQSGNNSSSNSGSQSGNNSSSNSGTSSSTTDTTSTDGKIPQTGELSDIIVAGSAIFVSVIGIVSFVVYKKIKI